MKRYIYLLTSISLVFIGCTSQKAMQRNIVLPTEKFSDTFKSVPQDIAVGEAMIERFNLWVKPGFIATTDYSIPCGYLSSDTKKEGASNNIVTRAFSRTQRDISCDNNIIIKKGSIWACDYKTIDGVCICNFQKSNLQLNYNIHIDSTGKLIMVSDIEFYKSYEIPNTPVGLFKHTDIIQPGSFKQELIYNGKSKDTLRVSYREYVERRPKWLYLPTQSGVCPFSDYSQGPRKDGHNPELHRREMPKDFQDSWRLQGHSQGRRNLG